MRKAGKGGASSSLSCDVPGCTERFVTYSKASMIREQAALAKWGRKKDRDLCPTHNVEAEVTAAVVPVVLVVPVAISTLAQVGESTLAPMTLPEIKEALEIGAEEREIAEHPAGPRKPRARKPHTPKPTRERRALVGTLPIVADILRDARVALSSREIVERAGDRLPSKSKTPMTVVSRDLALNIKLKGDASTFVRTAPGRFALRELTEASG